MTRLVLVRHGESIVTVNRIIGGHRTCTGLSPLGRTQAERLRDRWLASSEFTADVLISSHYARALETARIVAPALGGLEPIIDDGFGEHDPGPECDGLKYSEFTERYPSAGRWWETSDPFAATFPGGSISGAPKVRAMEIIAELEPTVRGPYCGSVFYVGPGNQTDSNLLIRSFVQRNGWLQCNVGGGIVAQSNPAAEYEETLTKAAGMLKALDR